MDGLRHEAYTLATLGLLTLPLLSAQEVHLAASFLTGGTIGTLLLSPDLDVPESRASRRWGPLSILWAPYRMLHPHRGASHSYFYGPFSRLIYTGMLLLSGAVLLGHGSWFLEAMREVAREGHRELLSALGGYLFSQWAHLWQDGIRPWRKRGGKWVFNRLWR